MPPRLTRLNLRHNPFGEFTPQERSVLAVVDTTELTCALRQPRTALQLIGRCGRGKSTHLHALARALPEATYLRLWTDRPPPPASPAAVLLLDEADAVWPWQRYPLLRAASSVALAVHRDYSPELRLHGFRVVTHRVATTDLTVLRAIVDRRIEAARLAPGPVPHVTDPLLAHLLDVHGDNIRVIEDVLYSRIQQLKELGNVDL